MHPAYLSTTEKGELGYYTHFEGDVTDIQQAILYAQEAFKVIPQSSPVRAVCLGVWQSKEGSEPNNSAYRNIRDWRRWGSLYIISEVKFVKV